METIEHNLGIKVDHYVIFDQYSAEGLIDAMGGVTIDNPTRVRPGRLLRRRRPRRAAALPGRASSISTATRRWPTAASARDRRDFDRIERQQRVGVGADRPGGVAAVDLPPAVGVSARTEDTVDDGHEHAPVGGRALDAQARPRQQAQDEVAGRCRGLVRDAAPRRSSCSTRRRCSRSSPRRSATTRRARAPRNCSWPPASRRETEQRWTTASPPTS